MLARAADVLAKERGVIESQITADMGKTLTESGGELDEAIGYLRFAAAEGRRREGDVNPNGVPGRMSFTLRGPLGVVGVITAWSFPVAIPLWKLAAALLTGNTCVWKPASATAMTGPCSPMRWIELGCSPACSISFTDAARSPVTRSCTRRRAARVLHRLDWGRAADRR